MMTCAICTQISGDTTLPRTRKPRHNHVTRPSGHMRYLSLNVTEGKTKDSRETDLRTARRPRCPPRPLCTGPRVPPCALDPASPLCALDPASPPCALDQADAAADANIC